MAMPDSSANPESLAVLSEMVNKTLIDTGRFFRSSGSAQSRAQLKAAIPSAHDNFQVALDKLSEQIFIAKALLEKDYEAIKAKKAVLSSPEPVVAPSETQSAEDVAMTEAPIVAGDRTTESVTGPSRPLEDAQKTEQISAEIKTETGPGTKGAPEKEAGQIGKQDNNMTTNDRTLAGTAGEELNFDSMLVGNGTDDFGGLNLNFANDDVGNQNFLAGNFMDSGAGDGTNNDQDRDHQGSISSLLPGLESYAANNAGNEFNLELQKLNNDSNQQLDGQTSMGQDDIMAGESSFDDLFMEKENFGVDDDEALLGGDGLMNLGEFDDSWFK